MYALIGDLERHCEQYADWFSVVDAELYRIFNERAGHSDVQSVYAKVTILNRVYMTGLERSSRQVDPAARVAQLLCERAAELDSQISMLRGFSSPAIDVLADAAAVHGWLVHDVLGGAGVGAPVSFASKYLHFHAPVVPIYDGLACDAVAWYIRARFGRFVATEKRLPKRAGQDPYYRWLCARFIPLWDDVQQSRPGTTMKELDHHLWQLGAGR